MIRRFMLPLVALAGVIFAIFTVVQEAKPRPIALAAAQPSQAPFHDYVAGSGIVEAYSENIQVGSIVPGVVRQVHGEARAAALADRRPRFAGGFACPP
jgi:multidrug efflux pump subunit AcrA (membrane-fusion protein)